MRGLSLSQPWCWAILDPVARKWVENRTWAPPIAMIDQVIALHAAKSWDKAGTPFLLRLGIEFPARYDLYPSAAIVGTARIDRVVTDARTLPPEQARWYMGPTTPDGRTVYGWVLADVRPLARPIPCRGLQGLWPVPPDVLADIDSQRSAAA